jgi:hypothetical protein
MHVGNRFMNRDSFLPAGKGLNGKNELPRPDITPLNAGSCSALVIRHSERFGGEVADHTDGLTPNGMAMAMELGSRLRGRDLRLYASPIQRCVDTARLIAEGAGCGAEVVRSSILGIPGPYVIDEPAVDRHLAVMGLKGFAIRWLSGGISPKVMRPCSEGSRMLVRWIGDNLASRSEGVDVYVGHDLFLTPVLVQYAGYDLETEGFLGFLDGFCLAREGGGIRLTYRKKVVTLDGIL